MQKSGWILSVLVFTVLVMIAGCIELAAQAPVTPVPVAPRVSQESGDIQLMSNVRMTTAPPTPQPVVTVKTTATKAPSATRSGGPMAAPVTLKGFGNEIVWFETVGSGVVSFKIKEMGGCKYGICAKKVDNCDEKKFVVKLAGASVDSTLLSVTEGGPGTTATKTFNLINPDQYSLSVRSCTEWEVVVGNA